MAFVVEGSFGKVPIESIKQLSTDQMALVALTVQNFMVVMFDEIKRAGFSNLEFLEKGELFLRCVTPSYARADFETILAVFNQIQENFYKTKFYYGLVALREVCTQENENVKVLLKEVGLVIENYDQVNASIVIFSSHLIENLIKFIQGIRRLQGVGNMSIDEMRFQINSNFQNCLLHTITEVNITINKLKV
jgi:hypothetical protein